MRVELKYGLLLNTFAVLINRFVTSSVGISHFLCGAFLAMGFFCLVVNLLPQNIYDNLLYRKRIAGKNG